MNALPTNIADEVKPERKISNRKIAWRKHDVLEWARDPEAWCKRNAKAVQA
jgi:hypothetical protein